MESRLRDKDRSTPIETIQEVQIIDTGNLPRVVKTEKCERI